jgi:hypothetical protein
MKLLSPLVRHPELTSQPGGTALGAGCVYLDPESMSADWRVWREVFFPRHAFYATDYGDAAVIDVGAHKGHFARATQRAGDAADSPSPAVLLPDRAQAVLRPPPTSSRRKDHLTAHHCS